MRSKLQTARLALVLGGVLAATAAQAGSRHALLVGIGRYPEGVTSRAAPGWSRLAGPVNDVAALRDLLVARYGFRREEITVLLDGEATRQAVLDGFRRVLMGAAPGDVGLFYFAGHGSWIRNSLSREPDRRDETIVPFDGADIRDKELARLMAEAARRGLILTAVFDSCHSGSMSRGISVSRAVRAAPPAEGDARDPGPAPTPSEAGALVLSAAQEQQSAAEVVDEHGVAHGAFTSALLEILREAPLDADAESILLRTQGLLRASGVAQDPVLDAPPARRRAPLLGPPAPGADGRLLVSIGEVRSDRVEILAGLAVGLAPGAVLVRVGGASPVRVLVDDVPELSRSTGHRSSGAEAGAPVAPGDLFAVERWAAPGRSPVRVHLDAPLPASRLRAAARELSSLRGAAHLRWVPDPSDLAPTHVLFHGATGWRLRWPDGREEPVGDAPRASAIAHRLQHERGAPARGPPCDAHPCLYVRLPIPAELEAQLARGSGLESLAARVAEESDALYLLAGRVGRRGQPEFAWVLATASAPGVAQPGASLPRRSAWRRDAAAAPSRAATGLEEELLGIARVRAWLTLEPPPTAADPFPYRLALQRLGAAGPVEPGGMLHRGEIYDPVLVAEPGALARGSAVRHVYVLILDSSGRIRVLFPPDRVSLDNRVPAAAPGEPLPGRIPLPGGRFRVVEPLGPDAYLLLATERPLPALEQLEQHPVTRGGARPGDALLDLLAGAGTRGSPSAGAWSIDRVAAPSVR